MNNFKLLSVGLLGLLLSGCGGGFSFVYSNIPNGLCVIRNEPGIVVRFVDARTRQSLVVQASGFVTDGGYQESLRSVQYSVSGGYAQELQAAYNRPGIYDVQVIVSSNSQLYTFANIQVFSQPCNIQPTLIEIPI
ncbi:hypothetical protein ACMYR3_14465 [Ampullimonas aquatilis]|uniref:hypothetical protein n=1 Tax=Ampullimonas aquatilis TaxID=1341549 RepID=UPI003C7075E6